MKNWVSCPNDFEKDNFKVINAEHTSSKYDCYCYSITIVIILQNVYNN